MGSKRKNPHGKKQLQNFTWAGRSFWRKWKGWFVGIKTWTFRNTRKKLSGRRWRRSWDGWRRSLSATPEEIIPAPPCPGATPRRRGWPSTKLFFSKEHI